MTEESGIAGEKRLAARLRAAWLASGLTQREVVGRVGWFSSPSYLTRALNGKQTLSLPALKALAGALRIDYREVLTEAGFSEESYRSRHARPAKREALLRRSQESTGAMLVAELQVIRKLKRDGKPEEARGGIAAVERMVMDHLGGFPAEREAMLAWASLLCERVGIAQDVQLPQTVLATTGGDLDDIFAIVREYDDERLCAVGHFHAGDAHFKADDYSGAVAHYEWSARHTRVTALRVGSLAGWAIAVAHMQRSADGEEFGRLRGQITELLSFGGSESSPDPDWDGEDWLLAGLWSEATLTRSLVVAGKCREAEQQLEGVSMRYEQARAGGFTHLPFDMSLTQLRFLAACEGVFDVSEDDILQLGLRARRLAEDSGWLRTKHEIESLMVERFGFREWN